MGVVRLLPILSLVLTTAAWAGPETFKRGVAGAEVDWSVGTVTAQAGAAADIRMPGPNAARPGAERRARAAAEAKLSSALGELGLDKLSKDKPTAVSRIEYQSNGGVVLWLSVRFSDLVPAKAAPVALKVATMPFEVAPTLVLGAKQARVASATYRAASTSPKDVVSVRRDDKGRLVLPSADLIDSLAGSAVVIYLEQAKP
jgi:hypothetical protein